MREITKTYKVYKFDELSEEAQQRIYATWRHNDHYDWDEENATSLRAFAKYFDISTGSWEYGSQNYINFNVDSDEISLMSGPRLMVYLQKNYPIDLSGNCPFTGYCMDETLLDPIRAFLEYPSPNTDYQMLMSDCLHKWLYACRDDYEHWLSPEAIKEDIEANEHEFTEDGKLAP